MYASMVRMKLTAEQNELRDFAVQLAGQAGELLRNAYSEQDASNMAMRTSPKDMKLAEDKTLDDWLVNQIQKKFPEHGVLAEESGKHNVDELSDAKVLWIIDPIDGSVNFSTRNPFVAISLAVMIDGELTIGVIEAPLLGEQFVAVKGQGATLNGKRIRVSETASMADGYFVSCDGGMQDRVEVFSTLIRNFYDQVKDFRKLGSAALECAWVACGRADAYITMAIDPWDVAAGVLLVQEAGGKVTNFKGEKWQPKQMDIICSNKILHEQIMERMWV